MRNRFLFALIVTLSGACAPAPIEEPIASTHDPITYGADALDVPSQRAPVRLYIGAGYRCTGTLISPTVVISAGHCGFPGPADPFATNPYTWQNLTGSVSVQIGGTSAAPALTVAATHIRYTLDYDVVALRLASPVPASVATPWRVITQHPSGGDGTTTNEIAALLDVAEQEGYSADLWQLGWGRTNQWWTAKTLAAANGAEPMWVQCMSTHPDSRECLVLSGPTANELHHLHWQGPGWPTDTLVSSTMAAVGDKLSCASWDAGRIDCYWNQHNPAVGFVEMRHAAWQEGSPWGFSTQISNPTLSITGSPSCTSWGFGRIDCFSVVYSDRRMLHMWYQLGGGQGYEVFSDVIDLVGNPVASSMPPDHRLRVAVLTGTGINQRLRVRGYSDATKWTWTTLGTGMGFAADPAIVTYLGGKTLVVGRLDSNSELRSRYQSSATGSWSGWSTVNSMTSLYTPVCTPVPEGTAVGCVVSDGEGLGSDFRVIGFGTSGTWDWDTSYYTLIGGNYNGVQPSLVPSYYNSVARIDVFNLEPLSRLTSRFFVGSSWNVGPLATQLQASAVLPASDSLTDMITVTGSGSRGSHTLGGDSGGPLAIRLSSTHTEYALIGVLQGGNAWADANPATSGAVDGYTPTFISFRRPGTVQLNLSDWFESFQLEGAVTGAIPTHTGTVGSPGSGNEGCAMRPGSQGPLIPLGMGFLLAGAALVGRRRQR